MHMISTEEKQPVCIVCPKTLAFFCSCSLVLAQVLDFFCLVMDLTMLSNFNKMEAIFCYCR